MCLELGREQTILSFIVSLMGGGTPPREHDCSPPAAKEQNLSWSSPPAGNGQECAERASAGPCPQHFQVPAHLTLTTAPRQIQGQIQSLWGFVQNENMGPLFKKQEKSTVKCTEIYIFFILPWVIFSLSRSLTLLLPPPLSPWPVMVSSSAT